MTHIYEALKKEQSERENVASTTPPTPKPLAVPKHAPRNPGIEAKLLGIYQRIESQLGTEPGRVVQFVGVHADGASEKIVREFTYLLSERLHKRVLLLTADRTPDGSPLQAKDGSEGWQSIVSDARRQLEDSRVHRFPGSERDAEAKKEAGTELMEDSHLLSEPAGAFGMLREHFDLILLDAPPLGRTSEAVVQSSLADGVVLVAEAGKTRWQVIRHWMQEIEAQQGTILGLVLNKRKFYIPEFIYRRL